MRPKSKVVAYAYAYACVLGVASACSAQEADSGAAETGGRREIPTMSGQRGGMMDGPMMQDGMMGDDTMGDMATIHGLLQNHESIDRRVENIAGGVRTVTTSADPEVAALIRRHVREMKARYGRGQPIRPMDPVFRELFRQREKASLQIEDVPGGVQVIHTSDDPQVASLIRQHAHRFVSEAAEQGMRRVMRKTPLPEDYNQMQ